MKKLFVNVLVCVGLLLAAASAKAQSLTYSGSLSAGTTAIFTYPVNISKITVAGAGVGATTATFFDNSTTTTTYTNAAYTSMTSYPTNITSIITNSAGNLQTNIYSGVFTTTTTVAANTNTFPTVAAYTAPSTGINGPNLVSMNTVRGLAVTVTTNAIVTIEYKKLSPP
ncbi:MAG: hypothetical protein EBS84_20245 [Proteobacteria bacterium]|nr:hypothetical protein [Verrucomicrobiota bacterium]NBU11312.1 hypothetical protein [Pseudomonadota bacterium]